MRIAIGTPIYGAKRDSKDELAPTLLRTDGRNFGRNFDPSANGCWPENCDGNHKGEHHTGKSKDKAVVAVLEISSFVGGGEQRHYPLLIRSTQYALPPKSRMIDGRFSAK